MTTTEKACVWVMLGGIIYVFLVITISLSYLLISGYPFPYDPTSPYFIQKTDEK